MLTFTVWGRFNNMWANLCILSDTRGDLRSRNERMAAKKEQTLLQGSATMWLSRTLAHLKRIICQCRCSYIDAVMITGNASGERGFKSYGPWCSRQYWDNDSTSALCVLALGNCRLINIGEILGMLATLRWPSFVWRRCWKYTASGIHLTNCQRRWLKSWRCINVRMPVIGALGACWVNCRE